MSEPPNVRLGSATGESAASNEAPFRRVLGHYPTGVSIVTGVSADHVPAGLVVGSFTSVSLDPPLVGFLPSVASSSWPRIRDSGSFCVNILAADQEPLCRTFATPASDKFAGVDWRPAPSGSPILEHAVAWIDCDIDAVHPAGDHVIVVGRVRDLCVERATPPLVFFRGGYGRFSTHSLALGDARFGLQLRLLDSARPLMEELAERTGAQVLAAHCGRRTLTLLASAGSPSDAQVSATAIGQRLPLIPPLGIWRMAFAADPLVDEWLEHVEQPSMRDRYREALTSIRACGYCLGLASVESRLAVMIGARSGLDLEPTAAEIGTIKSLELDPLDYVPSAQKRERSDRRPVSLWAPVLTRDREVVLGLVLTGFTDSGHSREALAEQLLELASDVSRLAQYRIPPSGTGEP